MVLNGEQNIDLRQLVQRNQEGLSFSTKEEDLQEGLGNNTVVSRRYLVYPSWLRRFQEFFGSHIQIVDSIPGLFKEC